MKLSLVVMTPGKSQGKVIPVNRKEFLIGRGAHCHLRTNIPTVSDRHCAIRVSGDRIFLEDLKSSNGTLLNGRQVRGVIEIKNEDRVKVGPLELAVQVEAHYMHGTSDTKFDIAVPEGSTEIGIPTPLTDSNEG